VYLYNSNDDDNLIAGGYQMKSVVCVSSSDLKNWTDHGEVLRVPANGSWANNSWAPAAIERGGKFFLYFGNGGNGIGVASSGSPTGPFKDARNGALVTGSTPGASGANMWLFDPSVFIDDDGQGYLTFGGNGDSNARIIKLNSDMTSVSGSAIGLTAKAFFEASWLYKRKGIYYFTYSSNTSAGLTIDYMTSSRPTSGFTYRGTVAGQPPSNNNNNHHADFEFNGNWYHAYHNRSVATQAGISTTYRRNLGIENLNFDTDGTIRKVTYTTDGITQIGHLNPYVRVEAETTNAQNGIETENCSEGGMNVTNIGSGDWIRVRGVDFGSNGAESFGARVASTASDGKIELRLDSATGTVVGSCSVPSTGGAQTWANTTCPVTGASGIKDLYLRFVGGGFNLNYWQFVPSGGFIPGTGGTSGKGGASSTGGSSSSGGTWGRGGSGSSLAAGGSSLSIGGASANGGAMTNQSGNPSVSAGGNATSGGSGSFGSSSVAPGTTIGGTGSIGGATVSDSNSDARTDDEGCSCRISAGRGPFPALGWFSLPWIAMLVRRGRRRRAAPVTFVA
jgi:arabinoxylan arabinofuranohydrolase